MTENDYKTAVELLACCESWEAAVCVMGNVRAGDVAKLLKTILATTQQPAAQCTCPSGDGSLRWPCPVHPPESVPEELRAAINHMLDSDGSRGRYSAAQCGEAHDEIERLLTSSQPAASQTSSPQQKYWLSVHRYQSYLKFSEADAIRDMRENGGIAVKALYEEPLASQVPDGYRLCLIPLENTDAFHAACSAAFEESKAGTGPCGVFIAGHRAMLAAAPLPTSEEGK